MSRRVALPGASELFRPTQAPETAPDRDGAAAVEHPETPVEQRTARGTGRVRHDEKITV